MRAARLAFVFCLFLCAVPVWTLQTPTQSTPSPAPKELLAVNIANQALAAAGGISAIMAITDYTASGAIIDHQNQELQGSVTLRGLGLAEFREDTTLPTGIRSFAIGGNGAATKDGNGFIRNLNFRYQNPLMTSSVVIPSWQLAAALNDPIFGLSYKGTTEVDGNAVYDIRIQLMPPGAPDPNGVVAEYFGADFFIDTTTFQVRMAQDIVIEHFVRKNHYSNYKVVDGVQVPFSIDQDINGQPAQTIQLNEIGFNSGLQESAFVF